MTREIDRDGKILVHTLKITYYWEPDDHGEVEERGTQTICDVDYARAWDRARHEGSEWEGCEDRTYDVSYEGGEWVDCVESYISEHEGYVEA